MMNGHKVNGHRVNGHNGSHAAIGPGIESARAKPQRIERQPQQLACPGELIDGDWKPCRGAGAYRQGGQSSCPTCFGSGKITPGKAKQLGEQMKVKR